MIHLTTHPLVEARVLGLLILHPLSLARVPALEVGAFGSLRNQAVFAAMRSLEARGEPFDDASLLAEIDSRGAANLVDAPYLAGLAAIASDTDLDHDAEILGLAQRARDQARAQVERAE